MKAATPAQISSVASAITGSSIGKKFLMAATGFIAFGFVFGHMAGNLQFFLGQDQINSYAEKLHALGPLLWIIRLGLLAAFVAHIWLGIQLKADNSAARPIGYAKPGTVQASFASRSMIYSGLTVLAFFIYHILHFTAMTVDPSYVTMTDSSGRPDVYSRMIIGFSNVAVSTFYILAVGLLSLHISHGVASMLQSLGCSTPNRWGSFKTAAALFSVIIFLGFASIPISVLAGLVHLPGVN